MEDHLIEYIEDRDYDLNCICFSFSEAFSFLRKNRGYHRRGSAKSRRYYKKTARRQTRRYFKSIIKGKKYKLRTISGRDVL